MGAGATTAIQGASAEELAKAAGDLSPEQIAKLTAALSAGSGPFEKLWPLYEAKMKAGGKESESDAAIKAFQYNFKVLASGASTMMPESTLEAVAPLPELEKLDITPKPELLDATVVLKLNGGLGTGMGLDKAKSLLPVSGDNTFLDLIAKQVEWMKAEFNKPNMNFMVMNSFSTSEDTKAAFAKYPGLGTGSDLEFVQNKAPKVTAADLSPATLCLP